MSFDWHISASSSAHLKYIIATARRHSFEGGKCEGRVDSMNIEISVVSGSALAPQICIHLLLSVIGSQVIGADFHAWRVHDGHVPFSILMQTAGLAFKRRYTLGTPTCGCVDNIGLPPAPPSPLPIVYIHVIRFSSIHAYSAHVS